MCGILLVARVLASGQQSEDDVEQHAAACEAALRLRGPDHFGAEKVVVPCDNAASTEAAAEEQPPPALQLHLAASLLQLRGNSPSTSPLADANGNVLCFNGEVFGGLEVPEGSNDGQCLLAALAALQEVEQVPGLLSQLRGPWSLLYWQQRTSILWFGRDWLGRRSLLLKQCQGHRQQCLVLSSVAPASQPVQAPGSVTATATGSGQQQDSWVEVPPGVYSIHSTQLLHHLSSSSSHHIGTCTESANGADGGGSSSSSSSTPQLLESAGFCGAHSTNAATAAASTTAVAAAAGHGEDGEAPNGGILEPADLCSAIKGLKFHAWEDEQLLQLQRYLRAQHLVPTSHLVTQQQQQQQQKQYPETSGDAQQPQGVVTPELCDLQEKQQQQQQQRAQQVPATQEEASQLALQLLQASVSTRCWTINTLRKHFKHSSQQQQQQQHVVSPSQTVCNQGTGSSAGGRPDRAVAAPQAATAANGHLQQLLPPSPILILFSGGVDSTLIAALAHLALPPDVPIDLSNVCFVGGASPDRQAAHSALSELAAFAPARQWRLIEVNSSLEEVDQHAQHIKELLHPAGTVMDLNIGAALWLAARAEGQQVLVPVPKGSTAAAAAAVQRSSSIGDAATGGGSAAASWCLVPAAVVLAAEDLAGASSTPAAAGGSSTSSTSSMCCYRSSARVVLLGHGADEQCGGYGRHRTKFRLGSWQGLADELAVDVKRLWIRNLGRDDRLVTDHGREGRHPFLDEALMTALLNMPLQLLADLSSPAGSGDKRILRCALASLGFPLAAAREKRAIQFGTRIGKLSNQREFGSNRRANLMSAGQVQIHKLPYNVAATNAGL